MFDRGADRWLDQNVDACRLTREGRQSDALLDRRMACLDRALDELAETVDVVERARTPVTLDEAMRAAVQLPTLDECADVEALTERLPQPTAPLQRAEATSITQETTNIDVLLRTGGTRTGVADRATAAVARARSLGHAETLARALRSLAAIQLEDEAGTTTLATLREAITTASAAHDDRTVVELWSRLLATLVKLKQSDNAKLLVPAAEAAVARSTATVDLEVMFLHAKAQVAVTTGDPPGARTLYADSAKILEAAGAARPGSPLAPKLLDCQTQTALTYAYEQNWKRVADDLRPLVALVAAQYGKDHPALMRIHFNLAVALRHLRDDAAALVEFKNAARIGEARSAPSPNLVGNIQAVGTTLYQMEKYTEALPYLERALAMARTVMGPDDVRLAAAINDYASVLIEVERYDEARTLLHEQVAIYEKLATPSKINAAHSVFNLGNLEFKVGNFAAAIPFIERAIPMYIAAGVKDHYDADSAIILLAVCQINVKQWTAAQQSAERVLAQKDSAPDMLAGARFARGRALVGQGKTAAGMADVRAARAAMIENELPDKVAELDAWLRDRHLTL